MPRTRRLAVLLVLCLGLVGAGAYAATNTASGPAAQTWWAKEGLDLAGLKTVPRERTLVITPWGFDTKIPQSDSYNIYNIINYNPQREAGDKAIYETLAYTNLNTGEIIPWQAKSWEYNKKYTSITVHLRPGVKWSDGVPFTATDVKYTLEMLRDSAPDLQYSTVYKEWLKNVVVKDPLTAVINLNKPGPRFFRDNLALGWENHQVMMPEHIWRGQDPKTFKNQDLAKGWPVGTGAYKLVRSSPRQQVYDRRADYWGKATGFTNLPAPERMILIPASGDDAMAQLYIHNQADSGNPLQPGTYNAALRQNPKLLSWNASGPVWGAPDGCGYNLIFNTRKAPWSDRNVRLAINYALDRKKISAIGYENANHPLVAPFSGYTWNRWVKGTVLGKIIDKYNRDHQDLKLVEKYMTAAGFTKQDGKWAKDGKVLKVPVRGPDFFAPVAPPVAAQLRAGGFDAAEQIETAGSTAWNEDLLSGKFDMMFLVHCGSVAEPYDTLKDYHTKYGGPIGKKIPYVIASTRYHNPTFDKLIDQLESIGDITPKNPRYMRLAAQALDIYMRDMPDIMLLEELHVVVFNNTYWTGWPSAKKPYVAPYPPWEGWNLIMHRLKPTK